MNRSLSAAAALAATVLTVAASTVTQSSADPVAASTSATAATSPAAGTAQPVSTLPKPTGSGDGEPVEGPAVFDPRFTHGLVDVDGGRLHYVQGGTGPVVVLLHGWPETWWAWHQVMPALVEEHTVVALDLPGLGDSTVPADGYDTATAAVRVHQAVQALGHERYHLVAHDIGSWVGYALARDFPQSVGSYTAMEVPVLGYGVEEDFDQSFHFLFNAAADGLPEDLVGNDVRRYLDHFYDTVSVHPERIDEHSRAVYEAAYNRPESLSAGFAYYRAMAASAEQNRDRAGQRLPMPVLAIGSQGLYRYAVADSYDELADDVRAVVVPDSGHFIGEENPAFLLDCLSLFLDGSEEGADDAAPPVDRALETCRR